MVQDPTTGAYLLFKIPVAGKQNVKFFRTLYNYQQMIRNGVPLDKMSPEAQARVAKLRKHFQGYLKKHLQNLQEFAANIEKFYDPYMDAASGYFNLDTPQDMIPELLEILAGDGQSHRGLLRMPPGSTVRWPGRYVNRPFIVYPE